MKIISKFKDYYDYITHVYGIDELIIYNRVPFNKDLLFRSGYNMPSISYWRTYKSLSDYSFRWLCIMGEYYLQSKLSNSNDDFKIIENFVRISQNNHDDLIKLHKELNSPVFAIVNVTWGTFHIDKNIPILSDSGIASIISPEQMYQQLSAFINSVLRDNVDTKPPVQIDDKYKLTQAGFDAKISFRHRK